MTDEKYKEIYNSPQFKPNSSYDPRVLVSFAYNAEKYCYREDDELVINLPLLKSLNYKIPNHIKDLRCTLTFAIEISKEMCWFGIDAFHYILNKLIENETSKIKK